MFLRKRGTRERRKEGTASIRRVMFVSHELTEVFVEISIGFACKVSDRYSAERDKKNAEMALALRYRGFRLIR